MTPPRLSSATVDRLHVPAPEWRAAPGDVRVAHLGPGPFHRAHQAMVTDLAAACGSAGDGWGIGAYAARGTETVAMLADQDLLTSVLVRDDHGPGTVRVLGVLGAVGDRAGFADALVREEVTVATITVSEAHHPLDSARRLDLSNPAVASDLAGAGVSIASLPGVIHAGLLARWRGHAAPVSLLSCDNLRSNGELLRTLVTGFAEAAGAPRAYHSWLASDVAFPSTLVDRLTPRPSAEDVADAAALLGAEDRCAVATEPWWEWVVQDVLAAPAPPWTDVGVRLVDDVAPYEQRKLVLLNGAHTLVACWGLLLGHETVAAAMHDPDLAAAVTAFHDREGAPSCPGVPAEVAAYAARVRTRLASPGLRHRLAQIASDSSLKLGERVLPLARGSAAPGELALSAAAVAAWLRLHDPLAPVALGAAAGVTDPHGRVVRAALRDEDVRRAVRDALDAVGLVPAGDVAPFADRVTEVFSALRCDRPRAVLQGLL